MKKILLLGGSAQQVVAIETAKRMGLYTILCDYLPDNPGQYVADKYYPTSTTDPEAVLKVAIDEKIDAVMAYASDPAAPTAAYVAEQLGLPGLPVDSVDILCHKDRFRDFLRKNGFHTPRSCGYSTVEEAVADSKNFTLPVMVKPVDSSGSKGVVIVDQYDGIAEAAERAFLFSRSHRIIIEEYIERCHSFLIGGDIFVSDGEVVQWGLMNCHRDPEVNPLVPVGKSYPPVIEKHDLENMQKTLQDIVTKLHIDNGAMNVELIADKNHEIWPIDIGPRSGGNMIPDLLSYIYSTDVVEMCIRAAMGLPISEGGKGPIPYYATYNVHADRDGIFQGIHYSEYLQDHLIKECIYNKPGDSIEYFDYASKVIGIIFLKFEDQESMLKTMQEMNQHIHIDIENR